MEKGFTQMRHFLKLTKLIISGGRMVMLETEVSSFTFGKKCEGFGNLFSTLATYLLHSLFGTVLIHLYSRSFSFHVHLRRWWMSN